MILYVFSDSHGSLHEMLDIIQTHPPDAILHLGDGMAQAEDLRALYPQIPLYNVPGNCDFSSSIPSILELELEGHRLLLCHGHIWQVKNRMDLALAAAREAQADVLLYGHTHQAYAAQEADGLWVINPGAATASFAILQLLPGEIACELRCSLPG